MKSLFKKIFNVLFLLCFILIGLSFLKINKVNASTESEFFDFSFDVIGTSGWTESMATHSYTYGDKATVNFNAYKSSTGITDIPVTNYQQVSFRLLNGETIYSFVFKCRQWEDIPAKIKFKYSTNGGAKYTETVYNSTNFTLELTDLPIGTNALSFPFENTSKIGLESIRIVYRKTITYNANGGEGTTPDTTNGKGANITIAENEFTRTGYKFAGWNTQADGDGIDYFPGNNFVLNSDLELYAKWVDESTSCNVTFYDTILNQNFVTKTISQGSLTNDTGVEKEKFGYNFLGWYTLDGSSTGDWGSLFSFSTTIDSDTTLYARYTEESWKTSLEGKETKASLKYNIEHFDEGWYLVENANALKPGDQVVIVATDYDCALSTAQNSDNRGQASVTKVGNRVEFGADTQILTLESGTITGTLSFKAKNYLYAYSSSVNKLTEGSKANNSSFKITISSGVATIKAQGDSLRNTIKYDAENSVFTCFSAMHQDVSIYKYIDDSDQFTYGAIRFGIRLTVSEYESYISNGKKIGVELSYNKGEGELNPRLNFDGTSSRTIVRVDASGNADPEGAYYQFALVVKGLENFTDMEIEAKIYVTDGINYIYTQKAGTTNNSSNDYSFIDMVNYYYDNRISLSLTDDIIASLVRAKGILEP